MSRRLVGAVGALALLLPAPATSGSTPADYASCGVYRDRAGPTPTAQRRVNACMRRAWRMGRQARAVTVERDIDGLVVNYFFVRGKLDVLIVVDSTRTTIAPGWTRYFCSGIFSAGGRLGYSACFSRVETGKPVWLEPIRQPRR